MTPFLLSELLINSISIFQFLIPDLLHDLIHYLLHDDVLSCSVSMLDCDEESLQSELSSI